VKSFIRLFISFIVVAIGQIGFFGASFAATCGDLVVSTSNSNSGFLSNVYVRQRGQELRLTGWMGGDPLNATWSKSQIRGWVGQRPLDLRLQLRDGVTRASGWLGRAGSGNLTWTHSVTKKQEERLSIGGITDLGTVGLTYWGKSPKHPADRSLNGFVNRNNSIALSGVERGHSIDLHGTYGFGGQLLYWLEIDTCLDKSAQLKKLVLPAGAKTSLSQVVMALALVND